MRYYYGQVERQTVFDRERNQYLLMFVGIDGNKMVHDCIIYLEIRGDKIWIHRDGSADGMAGKLLAAGVLKENIVLGFYHPERRELTDFAVC